METFDNCILIDIKCAYDDKNIANNELIWQEPSDCMNCIEIKPIKIYILVKIEHDGENWLQYYEIKFDKEKVEALLKAMGGDRVDPENPVVFRIEQETSFSMISFTIDTKKVEFTALKTKVSLISMKCDYDDLAFDNKRLISDDKITPSYIFIIIKIGETEDMIQDIFDITHKNATDNIKNLKRAIGGDHIDPNKPINVGFLPVLNSSESVSIRLDWMWDNRNGVILTECELVDNPMAMLDSRDHFILYALLIGKIAKASSFYDFIHGEFGIFDPNIYKKRELRRKVDFYDLAREFFGARYLYVEEIGHCEENKKDYIITYKVLSQPDFTAKEEWMDASLKAPFVDNPIEVEYDKNSETFVINPKGARKSKFKKEIRPKSCPLIIKYEKPFKKFFINRALSYKKRHEIWARSVRNQFYLAKMGGKPLRRRQEFKDFCDNFLKKKSKTGEVEWIDLYNYIKSGVIDTEFTEWLINIVSKPEPKVPKGARVREDPKEKKVFRQAMVDFYSLYFIKFHGKGKIPNSEPVQPGTKKKLRLMPPDSDAQYSYRECPVCFYLPAFLKNFGKKDMHEFPDYMHIDDHSLILTEEGKKFFGSQVKNIAVHHILRKHLIKIFDTYTGGHDELAQSLER